MLDIDNSHILDIIHVIMYAKLIDLIFVGFYKQGSINWMGWKEV